MKDAGNSALVNYWTTTISAQSLSDPDLHIAILGHFIKDGLSRLPRMMTDSGYRLSRVFYKDSI